MAASIEEITSGLTRAVLADDIVTTSIAVATSTKPDEMDEIANNLGQTVLGGDNDQRLATLPTGAEKAVEEVDSETELHPARAAKKAEKGKGRQIKEEEQAIDALGAAWSNCCLEDDEEAKAQREAKRLQDQIQKEREDKIRALEIEEEQRESEEYEALERLFKEHGAKAHEITRKERKEEAERQLRLAAEAEEITLAEQRAQEEGRMQEEALIAQAQRDADDRVRLELSQMYERNTANAIAQANAQELHRQQQRHEAEQIAQYLEVVARQAQLAELERWQYEEQQRLAEQHQAYPQGEQVAESIEEMDTGPEGDAYEGSEMDTAPEIEASDGAEMDWEQAEDKTPLLAEPLIPSSQSMQPLTPFAEGPSAPIQELPSPSTSALGDGQSGQVLQPEASNNRTTEGRPMEAGAMPAPGATAATTAPARAEAEETVLQPPLRAATSPPRPAPTATPPRPVPTPPAPSSLNTIKIVFKHGVPNPTLAALRPTISACSPLGRLLSQQRSIPPVVLPQVHGKRAREDWEDGWKDKKKAKMEGELQLEVGGKRKREAEEFPGNKRVMLGRILGRALAVPGSRFTTIPSVTSPPTLAPTSTPPNTPFASPAPAPSLPAPAPSTTPADEPRLANPHRGLAEAIKLYNDLPTLRAEIEWMRAQRRLNTIRKETRGKKTPIDKAIKRTATPASYWSKYRENLSR